MDIKGNSKNSMTSIKSTKIHRRFKKDYGPRTELKIKKGWGGGVGGRMYAGQQVQNVATCDTKNLLCDRVGGWD